MFKWFKRREEAAPAVSADMRETLFGDRPLEAWGNGAAAEPWTFFAAARNQIAAGDAAGAKASLRRVLAQQGLESRHYLQAWHALRQLGEAPGPDEARVVYGMVVEMGMPKGLDLLATYADGTSRYYNFSGAGVVCDAPTPEIAKVNEMALEMCRQLMKMEITQPWTEPRRPAPGPGMCRISFLTPAGPHFAEAPVEAIAQDPNAGVFLKVATLLMKHLLELPKQPGK